MSATSAADARVEVRLDASWGIQGKLHGGYLLAHIVGAVLQQADPDLHPHPLAASAVYVTPPAPAPATVRVATLRAGRSVATYRAILEQDGASCVETLVTAGRLPAADAAPVFTAPGAAPPPTAALADCPVAPRPRNVDRVPGVMNHVDMRLDPATTRWAHREPAGRAESRGWLQMLTQGWDPLLAQFILADAPPPVTFDLGMFGWVPTLQLQVLLRRQVRPGWQLVRQHALVVGDGLLDEDCTLWDTDGRVTVQARQLAAYREG